MAYGAVLLFLFTIQFISEALWGQYMWIDHRNYPGGPLAFYAASQAAWYVIIGLVATAVVNILGDGLLVSTVFLGGAQLERLTRQLNRAGVPMFHHLGFTMACHRSSGTYIPGLLWCVELDPCHSVGEVAHRCAFGLSFFLFAVLAVVTVVESTLPGTPLLKGNSALLSISWYSLSVGLNAIVTSMICFRILRMRALTREVLTPELSSMYTGVATMLIESAVPFSILGICLIITVVQDAPPKFAFAYVWSIFCVESELSRAEGDLLKYLQLPSVSLPSNDHPPCLHGLCMA
jgi:hypothetical protein